MSGLVYIISAPSGSGKSTLVNELRKIVKNLDFSISYTTRSPRGSEQNGREYFFVSREEFKRMLERGEFLEHAEVFGNFYGTARCFLDQALARGNDLLLDIDVQGASQIKQKLPKAISIFVLPPSRKELELRLRRRSRAEGVNSGDIIKRRLDTASREIEQYPNYDYILVNDQLEDSIENLQAVVHYERGRQSGQSLPGDEHWEAMRERAEQCRQANMTDRLAPILSSFAI